MNTFKKLVGAPFRAAGWVAGQVKNGYDSATKVAASEATKAVAVVKKTTASAKTAARRAASTVWAGVKLVGRGVARAGYAIAYSARQVMLAVAAICVTSVAAVSLSALLVAYMALLAVAATGRLVVNAFRAVGSWLRGESGLAVASWLHIASFAVAFAAACWALCAVVAIAGMAAFAIPAAEIVALANASMMAALIAAGFSVSASIIEAVNTTAVVEYDFPSRRVIPVEVVDGVVHG